MTTAPYYQDEHVTLYHGDCLEVLSRMSAETVSAVITDPPYAERTHSNARSNRSGGVKGIGEFEGVSEEFLRNALTECGRVSQGWVYGSKRTPRHR